MARDAKDSPRLRIDGYVRVSKVRGRRGERFISPKVQRDAIRRWAADHHARVLHIFEELDESGGKWNRSMLEEAIARIEDGFSQGIVVYRAARFGRSLVDGLLALRRIETAGGGLYSVADGADASTDTGRLLLRINLSLAEYEFERASDSWRIANREAVARGVRPWKSLPPGYRRTRGGRLRLKLPDAEVIGEVFRLAAAGTPRAELVRILEENGVRPPGRSVVWTFNSLRRMLERRVYLGEIRWGEFVKPHAHPAIIDTATWENAQRPRIGPRGATQPMLLNGFLRCAGCGKTMCGHYDSVHPPRGSTPYLQYSCHGKFAQGLCPKQAFISARHLEAVVEDIALELLHTRRRAPVAALRAAEEALEQAEQALVAYRDNSALMTTLGERRFHDGVAKRMDRVRTVALDVAALRVRCDNHELPPATETEKRWPTMSIVERREVLAKVIDCVIVSRGRWDIDQRVMVCPTGTAPASLVRRNTRFAPVRSYTLRKGWITPAMLPARTLRWPRERLEHELGRFLDGWTIWPSEGAFRRRGRARLLRQVEIQGGTPYWAKRFDRPLKRRNFVSWTDERIRAALEPLLADRATFPTITELTAQGHARLAHAITAHGGFAHWAAESGLPRSRRDCGSRRYWTDERIEAALRDLSQDHDTYPLQREFRERKLAGMYVTIWQTRGHQWWADHLGLPRPTADHTSRRHRSRGQHSDRPSSVATPAES